MSESLLSVGLDVGTTTTQLIVSRLTARNKASTFAVPDMEITQRQVLYKGKVRFTPLIGHEKVDGEGIRGIVEREYRAAGICREDVRSGAIIITGETSRKENAAAVSAALADYAGDFVVATAGPDLESVLAAKGAGAVDYSAKAGKKVLHMDIGGGTSNLCLIEDGVITATSCLNVGGRLLKFENGTVTYVSPVLSGLTALNVGDRAEEGEIRRIAALLTQALEMAAGLRERTELLDRLFTAEADRLLLGKGDEVLSFSGGVADCIEKTHPPFAFGDMGPLLGKAIRESRLCEGEYRLGEETIRATVIGAGCHSAQLSGSTVYCRNGVLPLKNLPVARLEDPMPEEEALHAALNRMEGSGVLAFPGKAAPGYEELSALADRIAAALGERPARIALEADMAAALGQLLALRLPGREILCLDRLRLGENSYLDVGSPVGYAYPVVIKTLIFSH